MQNLRSGSHLGIWALCACMLLILLATPVRGQVWKGPGTDWNTASNWNPAAFPNSLSTPVTFGDGGTGINISSSVSVQSISFSNLTGNYFIAASAGQTLTIASSINVAAGQVGLARFFRTAASSCR